MTQASVPCGFIRYTLAKGVGDLTPTPGDELRVLNDAGEAFSTAHAWAWQRRSGVPLALRKGQPYIDLPPNFLAVVGTLKPGGGFLGSFSPTSIDEVMELRSGSFPGGTLDYSYAVENVSPELVNLLSGTELFGDVTYWTATSVTVTSNTTLAPNGATVADTLSALSTAGRVQQDVAALGVLIPGRDYVFSVYLKAGTATATDIELEQQGASASPETSAAAVKTYARVTWAAGVPSIALQTQQGVGLHTVGVETITDGFYRCWVALTYDDDPAKPRAELRCGIRPDATSGLLTVIAWGAQLDRYDALSTNETPAPRRYDPQAAAATFTPGPVVRRLAIFPAPSADVRIAATMAYRRRWKKILSETDTLDIPEWIEPLFWDWCRIYARGYHEEDEGMLYDRLNEIKSSSLWRDMVATDREQQVSFGPMRNTASRYGWGRNWGRSGTYDVI